MNGSVRWDSGVKRVEGRCPMTEMKCKGSGSWRMGALVAYKRGTGASDVGFLGGCLTALGLNPRHLTHMPQAVVT